MRVLLDNCVNHRLAYHVTGHNVTHVRDLGWADLTNGHLIKAAEEAEFDVLLTVDKSIRKQQNFKNKQLNLITLNTRSILLEDLQDFLPSIDKALRYLESTKAQGMDILLPD